MKSQWDSTAIILLSLAVVDLEFLSDNLDSILEVRSLPGAENLCLDFSWDFPLTSVGQYNRFPCSLIQLCAALGIAIEVSVYATSTQAIRNDENRE
ncbi:MAG: hypothetical protein NTY19_48605 [Planctomycetota bacterium]|nr:hypothetical protein [Planctomycetota bacterium]